MAQTRQKPGRERSWFLPSCLLVFCHGALAKLTCSRVRYRMAGAPPG